MTLFQIVQALKGIALTSPYIRTAEEGSIYDIMNANPHIKYGTFVISQTNHRQDELFDYYGFNIFVCDRLKDDLESNRLHIQSTAKEVLANTILTFCTDFYGITHNELNFIPFTEKFVDLTAGQYVQVTFRVPKALNCPDRYMDKYGPDYRLQELVVTVTENGIYEYEPNEEDYDGYKNVKLTVNVPNTGHTDVELEQAYQDGKEDGIEEQKSKLTTSAFTENGTYTREDGYSAVTVNVPHTGHTDAELEQAYEDGKKDQKALLEDITVDHNGEYENINGYGKVTVNVPQTGTSVNNQSKNVTITQNGEQTVTYDSGYTGLENVNIFVNVPQTGTTINNQSKTLTITQNGTQRVSYDSGYTGLEDVVVTTNISDRYNEGYSDGEQHQKSLLTTSAFTENGTYTKEDGYSAVTVNVPQTGYTQEDLDRAYEQGYQDGLNDCSGDTGITGYLTMNFKSNGILYWQMEKKDENVSDLPKTIEYRKNGGNWIEITSTTGGTPIDVERGTILEFRGNNDTYSNGVCKSGFRTTARYDVYNNIMSLIDSTNFSNLKELTQSQNFEFLFYNSNVEDAYSLILPATTLTTGCYNSMFRNCSSLVSAPDLPSTGITTGCCAYMFCNCTSLVTAPALPATTLASHCYGSMFQGCTNLVNAPELPARALALGCYENMFFGCTSLTTAPALPATALAYQCYRYMFYNCTSLTTAPELPTTTLANECYREMFRNCASLVTAPALPATTLASRCYEGMFYDCTSLNYIKCLATNISATYCLLDWLKNVSSSGTFVKKSSVTYPSGVSGIPSGWIVQEI